MSIEATNNSSPVGNISLAQTTAQPLPPHKKTIPSLRVITIVKNASSITPLSQSDFEKVLIHITQTEPNIKASIRKAVSDTIKRITHNIRFTLEETHRLESITATKPAQLAEKQIQTLRRTLPEQMRIALKTVDILKNMFLRPL